jgi:hypothetical protein
MVESVRFFNVATPRKAIMQYIVTLRFQYPAYDERNGIPFEVDAKSKALAIKEARAQRTRH